MIFDPFLELSGYFYNLLLFTPILIPSLISLNILNVLILCWSDNFSDE